METRDMVRGASMGARQASNLEGAAVRLRAVEESDLPLLVRWINDPDVMRRWSRCAGVLA